jgi:3-hydroxyacyl-[acyl-carrier-protein] dehydratase
MRWFWIDRYEEFVRGRHATAVKNVSLAEEHLHDHFPGVAIMPNSLIVEGMAQAAGLLVADAIDFNRRVVLAKVAAADRRERIHALVLDRSLRGVLLRRRAG